MTHSLHAPRLTTSTGKPTPVEPDFPNLSAVWATLNPTGVKASDYNPTNSPVACPDYTASAWEVIPTSPLPTLGQKHDFSGSPTSAGSSATATGGSGSSGSGSGGAETSASPSTGAAANGLGKELKGMGAFFAGAMAVFAWL
jgi:hypothetical protein